MLTGAELLLARRAYHRWPVWRRARKPDAQRQLRLRCARPVATPAEHRHPFRLRGVHKYGEAFGAVDLPCAVIYFDSLMSGYTVRGNRIEGARSGMLVHGGRDTTIVANTFSDVDIAVVLDDGGPDGGWPHEEARFFD
eukprot:COSAG04_NODE_9959_length_817_cov_1.001393_2_plen_138_part_00